MTTHTHLLLCVTFWLSLLFVIAAPASASDSSSLRGNDVGTTTTPHPETVTSLLSAFMESILYPSNEEEEEGEEEEDDTELMYLERYVEDGDYYFIYDNSNSDQGDGDGAGVDDYDYANYHDQEYDTNEEDNNTEVNIDELPDETERYLQFKGGYGRRGFGGYKGGRGGYGRGRGGYGRGGGGRKGRGGYKRGGGGRKGRGGGFGFKSF